jgi:hypothetical protein
VVHLGHSCLLNRRGESEWSVIKIEMKNSDHLFLICFLWYKWHNNSTAIFSLHMLHQLSVGFRMILMEHIHKIHVITWLEDTNSLIDLIHLFMWISHCFWGWKHTWFSHTWMLHLPRSSLTMAGSLKSNFKVLHSNVTYSNLWKHELWGKSLLISVTFFPCLL